MRAGSVIGKARQPQKQDPTSEVKEWFSRFNLSYSSAISSKIPLSNSLKSTLFGSGSAML